MSYKPGDILRVKESYYKMATSKHIRVLDPVEDSCDTADFLVLDGPNEGGYYHAWRLGTDEKYPAIKWDKACIQEVNPCS
jgi:hypothetical protein